MTQQYPDPRPEPVDRGDFGYPASDRINYPPMFQPPKPKKRRSVFLWVFLAIQALFIVWVIMGAATANGSPSDCGSLDADTCNTAADAGTALGVFIIVILWCLADFLLGVGYLIYRVARRP